MTSSPTTPTYARFWRCALQVNPSGYAKTYRGQDHGCTSKEYAQGLLETCTQHEIQVVGIADHGSVADVDLLREVLEPAGIVVFPGFEITSTEKIHMVCLYREGTTREALQRILGALDLLDPHDGVRPSRLGCLALAQKIEEQGGFWYAAHVTGNNGLLKLAQDGGGLPHVWRDSRLVRAAQIPGAVADLPLAARRIVEGSDPNYARERPIAIINAKDVARPDDLANPAATCWIKMTKPGFDAFKVAFLDPESRIRLHSDRPATPHSAIRSVEVSGGYLDGVRVELSEHLNTMIGGRGTGKSTLIECIRFALDVPPKGKQALRLHQDILRENLGSASGSVNLEVESSALHGARFTVTRRFGEPPTVRDAGGQLSRQGPTDLFPKLEIYGQNEIHEMTQPDGRARLLERFLPRDDGAANKRPELLRRLRENRQRLLKAIGDHDLALEQVNRLPRLREQLEGFQRLGVEAKLARTPLFARERQLMDRVSSELDRLRGGLEGLRDSLPDLTFLGDAVLTGLPHETSLRPIREELKRLVEAVSRELHAQESELAARRTAIEPLRGAWLAELAKSEREVEATLAQLPEVAGKSGREVGTAFKALTQEIERVRPLEARVTTLASLRDTLAGERQALLAELSDVRAQRSTELVRAVKRLNRRLDGKIQITLRPERERRALKEFLLASDLEGVGEKRLAFVEERDDATPASLVAAITGGADVLRERYSLTPVVADALARLPMARRLELEELELDHQVDIELNVSHGPTPLFRSLERLSTGQQATAVLHLILLDNVDPLIVDQPEDNLDNAFIAERIVHELRRAKTERQFLFATHNANIPVFGDAEWIGVVTATERSGAIQAEDQGSIDVPKIRDQVAEILEGGRAAFIQRKEKYDF